MITRDKSGEYGKVLVDDYPDYIEGWFKWRPRGLVIMPASSSNSEYTHPNLIRYDGSNLEHVKVALQLARDRGARITRNFSELLKLNKDYQYLFYSALFQQLIHLHHHKYLDLYYLYLCLFL